MRKVFLEELPHKGKCIDWIHSVGHTVNFIYDDIKGNITIIKSNKNILTIKYLDKNYKISQYSLSLCSLGYIIGKLTHEFKFYIGQTIKDDKRNLIITSHIQKPKIKLYTYHCNLCGYNGEISQRSLIQGYGCPACSGHKVIKYINDMWTANPELAKLLANPEDGYKYTYGSSKKVNWKCPECGNIIKNKKICDIYNYGLSCPKCSDGISYPEKFMYNLLQQLNVDFEYQKKFDWCIYKFNDKQKYGRYDFYIPSMRLIIEMDGGLGHSNGNKMAGQTKENGKQIDNIKDKLANEHSIEVIRIDCNYALNKKISRFNYIKQNILESKLSQIFNLLNINWVKIDGKSQKSLIKEACNLWNNQTNDLRIISNLLNLNRTTIIKYLNIGHKLGLCNYNGKIEKEKNIMKKSKSVDVFKDRKYIQHFKSMKDLSNKSKEYFKIYFDQQGIRDVCNGKRKQYKGFVFKYVD